MTEGGMQSEDLLRGISELAKEETERILTEARRQAAEIVEGAKIKAATILREAEERAEKQAEAIKLKYRQLIETERRKIRLQVQEELYSMAMDMVRGGIARLRTEPDYKDVLKGWIVEGALGLDRDRIYVNAPKEERRLLRADVLADCGKEASRLSGREVKIELSSDPPTVRQGVFLSAGDGRIAFNNEVDARLQRRSAEIRRMIYRRIQDGQTEK
jgi:F-type H+-transporting ATPase subunit b